jgi:hypothetical protein
MALGKIKADTLEHSTSGSVDTKFVVEGSAKHWTRYDQTGPTIDSSLNTSSIEDTSTGKATVNISSAFSSVGAYSTSGSKNATTYNFTISPVSASQYIMYNRNDAGSYDDPSKESSQAVGDLA